MSRLLVLFLVLTSCAAVSARLAAVSTDDFEVQGLELLQQRFGQAYPGYGNVNYGANVPLSGTQQWNTNVDQINPAQQWNMQQQQFGTVGAFGTDVNQFALNPTNIQQQYGMGSISPISQQQQFGSIGSTYPLGATTGFGSNEMFGSVGSASNVAGLALGSMGDVQAIKMNELNMLASSGVFGAGALAAATQASGSKKGQTTVAAPIYAESMVVPKIITQPILRPHYVQQPIVQQQLVQQPIVETRRVVQPIVRRIITQPIIRPQVIESTTIQPTLKTETIVQPHLIQQTVVQPQVQNVMEEAQPIQEKPKTQMQQPVVQPVQKKSGGGLSSVM